MNAKSNQSGDKESEKKLCVRQIKGKCYNCGTYGHNSRECTERKQNKKISTVRTSKITDTPLKNVTARRSVDKNERNDTIRVTNKRSAGRNKEITKKMKTKRLM